ncbi:MAG: hypothetical protein M2R45_01024 [Verrucomicrobia subdivision 3 bacterium]|nr:hypothetical protein [Limisphaerales bacterium]MCS1414136.1 hypothetical protein [Limisphaerales bacterium]
MKPKLEVFTTCTGGIPHRVYHPVADRPRRTDQGLKLTLVTLLTALALQPAATANSFTNVISNLEQPRINQNLGKGLATRFTVGSIIGRADHNIWTLGTITVPFGDAEGSISSLEASILSDSSGSPGDLFAPLTSQDPQLAGNYDFMPREGTEVFLQPGSSYWLAYKSFDAGGGNSFVVGLANSPDEDVREFGWSIGDRSFGVDEQTSDWKNPDPALPPLQFRMIADTAAVVPEPSEYALFLALGLGAFALWHRCRQQERQTGA